MKKLVMTVAAVRSVRFAAGREQLVVQAGDVAGQAAPFLLVSLQFLRLKPRHWRPTG